MVSLNKLTINNLLQDKNKVLWIVLNVDKTKNTLICKTLDNKKEQVKEFTPELLEYVTLNKYWLRRFRFTYGLKSGGQKMADTGWFSPTVASKRTNIYKITLHKLDQGGFCLTHYNLSEYDFYYVHELQNYLKILAGKEPKFLSEDMKRYVKI